jgi:hypothetical protein
MKHEAHSFHFAASTGLGRKEMRILVSRREAPSSRDEGCKYWPPHAKVWENWRTASAGGRAFVSGITKRERQDEKPGLEC